MAEDTVPNIIRAAGEQAVRAYREYLDNPRWSRKTREQYASRMRRFCRWAEARGLSLGEIDEPALAAFAAEIAATGSWDTAVPHRSAVLGMLRELARSGVLAVDSWPKGQANRGPSPVGFPLLDLLAMLGHMAEPSLSRILDEEAIALALLQQVRWPAGPECPHCGAADDGDRAAEAICLACAKRYGVTTGTMFEGSPVPVRLWLVVMQQMYLAESALSDEELCRPFGLGDPAVVSLRQRIGEAVAQEGLPIGDELTRALDVRNRDLGQEAYVRVMKDYMALEAERDRLLQARAGNTPADGLPPGMTLEEALAWVDARLAEHDKYYVAVEDGYLVSYPAESEAEREAHAV